MCTVRHYCCALALLFVVALRAQTSVTLTTSANPVVFGQPVTLTATVSPSGSSGKVAFYDGVTVLGTRALASGKAVFTTSLLAAGTRSLRVYFGGASGTLTQTVIAVPANGFAPVFPVTIAQSAVVGDFNGDGRPDVASATTGGVSVLLGNGDGTLLPGPTSADNAPDPLTSVIGDFNGDGRSDLAILDRGGVRIRLGNGDGSFQPPSGLQAGSSLGGIAIGDFNGDGSADLAIANATGVSILLGNGDGTFRAAISTVVPGTTSGNSVAVADFNRDGKADLAFGATGQSGSQIVILLGRGDGALQVASTIPVSRPAMPLVTADLNGDGRDDVVSINSSLGSINVLLSNGDGSFQPPVVYVVGTLPQGLVTGDFNGDGKLDVAVADFTVVNVLLGNGDGTLQPEVNYPASSARFIAAADFNGDGKTDLAVASGILLGELRPLTSTTLKSSLNPSKVGQVVTLTATVSPSSLGGYVTFYDGATVLASNLLVNGQTTLTLNSLAAGTHSLTAFYAGDTQYVASTSPVLSQMVSGVLPQVGVSLSSSVNPARYGQAVTLTATLSPATATGIITFYDGATMLETVPVSGGRATYTTSLLSAGSRSLTAYYSGDVSFAPGKSAVLMQGVNPVRAFGFAAAAVVGTGTPAPYSIAAGDFNGDGISDLLVVSTGFNAQASVLLGKGDGTFQPPLKTPAGSTPTSVAVGDFNGDGKADFALGNQLVFLGNGDGTFRQTVSTAMPNVMVGDFNGDGKADIAGLFGGELLIQIGNGDGTFQAPLHTGLITSNFPAFGLGDFNGDGKADLAVPVTNGTAVVLGNGDGTFRPAVTYPTSIGANAVAVGDFNGDGKPDLAVSNGTGVTVSILLGNGDGSFRPAVNYPGGNFPMALAVADFNGDGKTDLAVAGFYGNTLVLLGNGDGTLQPGIAYASGVTPFALATADFNGDGRPDLAVADFGSSNVDILLAIDALLKFTTQPVAAQSGVAEQVVVQLQDSNGRLVGGSGIPVTLTSNPGGFSATVQTVSGVATFPGVNFNVPGTYTLTASSSGLSAVNSNSFTVVTAPPMVAIDSPSTGATLTYGSFAISGWAIGLAAPGSGISSVAVSLDGASAGNATYGLSRPDVCAVYAGRPDCPNVGYSFVVNTTPGTHTITVVATVNNAVPNKVSASVTVAVQFAIPRSKAGVLRNGMAFLEDSNGDGQYEPSADRYITGFSGPGGSIAGDIPVAGDWTGDGHAKIGIYRSSRGTWYLDANNNGVFDAGDYQYQFGGVAGDIPFAGDWNGLGKSCVGIYRSAGSVWLLDLNCNGAFENAPNDAFFPFGGLAGDVPVVGAWSGGTTRVGVVRKYAPAGVPQGDPFYWVLDGAAANAGSAATSHPPGFTFAFGGLSGDVFITGDWYGTGISTAGVFRAGFWVLDAGLPGAPQANHVPGLTFGYGGVAGDLPLVGKW